MKCISTWKNDGDMNNAQKQEWKQRAGEGTLTKKTMTDSVGQITETVNGQGEEEETRLWEEDKMEAVGKVTTTVRPGGRWPLTSAGSLLAAPGQAFLANPAL